MRTVFSAGTYRAIGGNDNLRLSLLDFGQPRPLKLLLRKDTFTGNHAYLHLGRIAHIYEQDLWSAQQDAKRPASASADRPPSHESGTSRAQGLAAMCGSRGSILITDLFRRRALHSQRLVTPQHGHIELTHVSSYHFVQFLLDLPP